MAPIEKPIQLAASPAQVHVELCVQGVADLAKPAQANGSKPSRLDLGNETPRRSATARELRLRPAALEAELSKGRSESDVVHARALWRRALTPELPPTHPRFTARLDQHPGVDLKG
jgi:hypothetical protein